LAFDKEFDATKRTPRSRSRAALDRGAHPSGPKCRRQQGWPVRKA